jgi:aldose 1-epimerase
VQRWAVEPTIRLQTDSALAEVTPLAAALRRVQVEGEDLTEPVPHGAIAPQGNGLVLAPWPNRVRDGRWRLDGVPQQLAITEPALGNASHGLLRNTVYRIVERTPETVELAALIAPQLGWPFLLETWVRYELRADGLIVTHGARNLGTARAPWAVGAHPYFRVGTTPVEELELTVTGDRVLDVDERLNALDVAPVDAATDLRGGRVIGGTTLNTAYTGLANTAVAEPVAWLRAPSGRRTVLRADAAFGWLQVYTPGDHPRPQGPGRAVALEPMTAPPNALNSGLGLAWIEPGERWSAGWEVRTDVVE